MANFRTHLHVGLVASAAITLALHAAELIRSSQALPYFALGVFGSLLPDIDSRTSHPVKALFGALGVGLAFAMTLPLAGRFSLLELALLWLGVFFCVRYGFFEIFSRLTVHRGIWHSWLASAAVALGTTDVAFWLWRQPPRLAWLAGLMVGSGYLTHLFLDELYSVDLFGRRLKRSFGTALKPFSFNDPWSSLAMLAAVVALAGLAPSGNAWLDWLKADGLAALDTLLTTLHDRLERLLDLFQVQFARVWSGWDDWWTRLLR